MADISKITASNGTTYDIKDQTARDSIPHIEFQDTDIASVVVFYIGNSGNRLRFWYDKSSNGFQVGIKVGSANWKNLTLGTFS